MSTVDVVVAVRNEEESLPLFVQALKELPLPDNTKLSCIFVEDGSTDGTVAILRSLANTDSSIRYFCLERGFGQGPAVAFGVAQSQADAVIMMDVDGGHPVTLIPLMIEAFNRGAYAVQAVRRTLDNRQGYRLCGSFVFNSTFSLLTGVDTNRQNVFFRLISQDLAQRVLRDNRWKHFLRIRYHEIAARHIEYVEFDATDRLLGQSKYNFKRLAALAFNGVFAAISTKRFVLYSTALTIACVVLWQTNLRAISALGACCGLWGVAKFALMRRKDIFKLMRVRELSCRDAV